MLNPQITRSIDSPTDAVAVASLSHVATLSERQRGILKFLPPRSIRRRFDEAGGSWQQWIFRPIVPGIAAPHIPPRIGPGATPKARNIGGQCNRPSRR